MTILGFIIALLVITGIGFGLLRLVLGTKGGIFHPVEYSAISFLIGACALPTFFFFLGISGIPWNATVIFGGTAVLGLLLYWLNRKFVPSKVTSNTLKIWDTFKEIKPFQKVFVWLMLAWIVVKCVLGAISLSISPTYTDDTYANWNLRWKIFYERQSIIPNSNDPDYLGRGYSQYPITFSFLKTYISWFVGDWHEWAVNSMGIVFFVAILICLFFVVMRETGSVLWAMSSVYVLTSIPLFYIHATNPYVDAILAGYILMAVYFVYLALSNKIPLLLAIIFLGILGYWKTEGLLIFSIAICGALLVAAWWENKSFSMSTFRKPLTIIGGMACIISPFLLFKLVSGLGFGNGNTAVGNAAWELRLHTEILPVIKEAIFFEWNYNLLFPVFIAMLIAGIFIRKRLPSYISVAMLTLIFGFGMLFMLYIATPLYKEALHQTGLNRSIIQLTPLMIFVIILLAHTLCKDIDKPGVLRVLQK